MGVRSHGEHPEEAGQGPVPPHRADLLPQPQRYGEHIYKKMLQGV